MPIGPVQSLGFNINPYDLKNSVRAKFGQYGHYKSEFFTEKQLDAITEVVAHIVGECLSQFEWSVSMAIKQATPTPDQIHKLFLDKLMEHDK